MKKLRHWFIGDYLAQTDDVFVRAKIELLFNFSFFFCLVGSFYYVNLILHELWYHVYIISFAVVALLSVPFVLKYSRNVRLTSNWYLIQQFINSAVSTIIQEGKADMNGAMWFMLTVLFAFFLYGRKWGIIITMIFIAGGSAPFLLSGYVDIPDSQQIPPGSNFFIGPFLLNIYVVWMFIKTRENAEQKINSQKEMLETKNKEITDSIQYARRIQNSLMPSDKYIARVMDRLRRKC